MKVYILLYVYYTLVILQNENDKKGVKKKMFVYNIVLIAKHCRYVTFNAAVTLNY